MKPIAEVIRSWLDSEHVKWEASREVVTWAEPFGIEIERAWNECPRADFLMALAGACEADPEPIVALACAVAREALVHVPKKWAEARKAVYLAETLQSFDPLGPSGRKRVEACSRGVQRVFDALGAEEERIRAANDAASREASGAFMELAERVMTTAGQTAPDGEEGAALIHECIARALEEPAIARRCARSRALDQVLAAAHATRAADACLTVAVSASAAGKASDEMARRLRGATNKDLEDVIALATIAGRSRARVFTEAALCFDNAAMACGRSAVAEPETDAQRIAADLTMMASVVQPLARDEAGTALSGVIAAAADRKALEIAQRVRAVLPFSALKPPQDEVDREAAAQRDPRGTLRDAVERLSPIARLLGDAEAAEAADTCVAILDATGPLDRRQLAPALRTFHERVAAMFARRAAMMDGEARAEALAQVRNAERAAAEVQSALAALRPEAPN